MNPLKFLHTRKFHILTVYPDKSFHLFEFSRRKIVYSPGEIKFDTYRYYGLTYKDNNFLQKRITFCTKCGNEVSVIVATQCRAQIDEIEWNNICLTIKNMSTF